MVETYRVKHLLMIGCKGRRQYIDPDKCEVSWSPLTNHQWPGTFSRHTLLLPPTHLQKSKVPFSFYSQTVGPSLFHFIWYSRSPPGVVQFISVCYTIRERETFFGFRWVRGNFETLCNDAAKVLKGCESVLPAKYLRVGSLEKRSPCCIHTEWRATSSRL